MVLDTCIKGNKKQFCVFRRSKTSNRATKTLSFKINPILSLENEDDLITGFNSYMESYIEKQDVIHKNAQSFNEDG